jgi:hypothetical protein
LQILALARDYALRGSVLAGEHISNFRRSHEAGYQLPAKKNIVRGDSPEHISIEYVNEPLLAIF